MLKVQLAAKAQGFSDVIYLDAVNNTFIEEVSSCNFFVVNGTPPRSAAPSFPVRLVTPALPGSVRLVTWTTLAIINALMSCPQ